MKCSWCGKVDVGEHDADKVVLCPVCQVYYERNKKWKEVNGNDSHG